MNKIIKNKIIATIFTLLAFTNAMSQVDSSFTYQGELLDNGAPANGQYDINIDLIDGDLNPWGSTSVHSPVEVVNGVFSVNADFGISAYDGYKDVTVTVSVRKTSEGPGGAFTTLGSQTIQAVPLATSLTNGNATVGQVFTFNGFQWGPSDPVASSPSPWTVNGNNISYDTGQVNIGGASGITATSKLNVKSNGQLTATFDGGSRMYVFFRENGASRGYVGSYQDPSNSGINDEDFEIGTTAGSAGSMHIVTGSNEPRITVSATGNVGINNTNPLADLIIDATTDGDVLRARVDGTTKFYVDDNGGAGVGAYTTPPTNGLRVEGDVKQSLASNGMMKYMVRAVCSNVSSSITRSYNGVDSGSISISNGASTGKCIIDFPSDISDRYYQVSAMSNSTGSTSRAANCTIILGNLSCARFNSTTGSGAAGSIMVLVY